MSTLWGTICRSKKTLASTRASLKKPYTMGAKTKHKFCTLMCPDNPKELNNVATHSARAMQAQSPLLALLLFPSKRISRHRKSQPQTLRHVLPSRTEKQPRLLLAPQKNPPVPKWGELLPMGQWAR